MYGRARHGEKSGRKGVIGGTLRSLLTQYPARHAKAHA